MVIELSLTTSGGILRSFVPGDQLLPVQRCNIGMPCNTVMQDRSSRDDGICGTYLVPLETRQRDMFGCELLFLWERES